MASTVNMNLTLPDPTITIGPTWATLLNTAITSIDSHDHSSGKGVKVTPTGININSEFDIQNNDLLNLNSSRYRNLSSTLSGLEDIRSIYSVNGDLYWNNSAGAAVQITSGLGLNASVIGGIGGDYQTSPATLNYIFASTTFFFNEDTNKSANIDVGNIVIREPNITSTNGITLKSPTSLAAPFNLILPPSLPGSGSKFMRINSSGEMDNTVEVDDSTLEVSGTDLRVKDDGISRIKIQDSAIDDNKLNNDAVTTNKIINLAVTSSKLAENSVITSKILDENVTTDKIADLGVTTPKIADSAVTLAKIPNLEITGAKIANQTITTGKLVIPNFTESSTFNSTHTNVTLDLVTSFSITSAAADKLVIGGNLGTIKVSSSGSSGSAVLFLYREAVEVYKTTINVEDGDYQEIPFSSIRTISHVGAGTSPTYYLYVSTNTNTSCQFYDDCKLSAYTILGT